MIPPGESSPAAAADDLLLTVADLLFSHGQTTEKTIETLRQLADKLGVRASVFPRWGDLTLRLEEGGVARYETIFAQPASVDMHKVAATMGVVAQICGGQLEAAAAPAALETIKRYPPVTLLRAACMTGAGAAALGALFGAARPFSLLAIALTAGLGACLRRRLGARSGNLFVQPFCAALLAGMAGAIVLRWHGDPTLQLVALCPCMVLVPGPHLLNGALDLARGRIPLGAARLIYAGVIIVMICAGLLLGLSLGGVTLPAASAASFVSFGADVVSAGVAVAAYGTFFSMPWRMLPVPVGIGMLAHAGKWAAITGLGAGAQTGVLCACLVVGTLVTPVADRLRLPFAGLAFASVVSMLPGVYLFRMAGGLVALVQTGAQAPAGLVTQVVADGATSVLIILAMVFGLIVPKLCLARDHGAPEHPL